VAIVEQLTIHASVLIDHIMVVTINWFVVNKS